MNCKKVKILLPSYTGGELSESERPLVVKHLAGCDGCRSALADYESTGARLAVLETVPVNTDILESTISRIKAASSNWQVKFGWPRFAFMGAAAIMLVFVLTTIMALPVQTPKDMLAQALTNTQNTKSLRFSLALSTLVPGSTEWNTIFKGEISYAGPDRVHSITQGKYYSSTEWESSEQIILGNTVYYNVTYKQIIERYEALVGENHRPTDPDQVTTTYKNLTESIQQPLEFLSKAAEISKQQDEEIDGITCYHYHGKADMEKYIQQYQADAAKEAREKSLPLDEREVNSHVYWLRTKVITYEFWVGKSDNIVHQWTNIIGPTPDRVKSDREEKMVTRYYDLGREINIEPPLDAQGNLLPGWFIQAEE
jgi:hypothetical protein